MTGAEPGRSRPAARLKGVARTLLGRPAPQVSALQERADHHDRALRDITAALQAVQATLPSDSQRMDDELRRLQQRVDVIEQHLPELLGLWSSANGAQRRIQRQLDDRQLALEHHSESIQELWQRIEFVRREVMYELRYSTGSPTGGSGASSEPEVRVVDQSRVDELAAAGGLRLNLGCGHLPIEGFVNVDMRELPGVDVVAPIDRLPFDDGSVDEIHSAHVLEHFPEEELRRRLLPYWYSKLRPGGTFRAVVPDGAAMVEGHARGEVPFEELRAVLYGGQEYEGDFHFTMFSAESLGRLLGAAGFTDVEVEASGRPNDICLELQIAARRPD